MNHEHVIETMESAELQSEAYMRSAIRHKTVLVILQELLRAIDEVVIFQDRQSVETHAFLPSEVQEQNVFEICDGQRRQFLSATQESVFCIRMGFGSKQNPNNERMQVLSTTNTRYDVLHMFRSLNCDACYLPISLLMADVYAPLRELCAKIEQEFDLFYESFRVKDNFGNILFRIIGQDLKRTAYKIKYTNETVIGFIRREMYPQAHSSERRRKEKTTSIEFSKQINEDVKMLILAAALFIMCM